MSVWAIVPVKPLNRAKSRLAPVLPADVRERLAAEMLSHTVAVLERSGAVSGVLVVSRDNRALVIARRHGARTVQESGTPALSASLERATRVIASWNAQAALILPADLPLLTEEDLRTLVDLGRYHGSLVLTPDRHEQGTNALFMRPPYLLPAQLGNGSFHHYVTAGEAMKATVHIFRSERLMLDLDTPDDLRLYLNLCQKYAAEPMVDTTCEVLQPFLAMLQKEKP